VYGVRLDDASCYWTADPEASMDHERATYTVEQAARVIGLGRASAYAAVRRGDIPSIRIGRRVVVPRAALERMLAGQGAQSA
jgi:excisionase family DNA binding protein